MADETGGGAEQAPMVWALSVREVASGPPYAEAIVEVGPELHSWLVEGTMSSGFTLAAGEPPATTAVVEVRGHRLTRLVLVGGREVWEPASLVEVSPTWLSAAEGRAGVVVIVVPPGTWPPGLMDLPPHTRIDVFTRSLEDARTAGLVLHGMADIDIDTA